MTRKELEKFAAELADREQARKARRKASKRHKQSQPATEARLWGVTVPVVGMDSKKAVSVKFPADFLDGIE